MRNNTIIKLILLIFFIVFFGFLFFYFYNPNIVNNNNKTNKGEKTEDETSLFPFWNSDKNKKENTEQGKKTETENKNYKPNKDDNKQGKEEIPVLRQISKIPTAGAYVQKISKSEIFEINKKRSQDAKLDLDGEYSEIRYISTKNNHLYRSYDFTLKDERISNITIPKIFNSKFFDKNNYIVRYLNDNGDIKSYSIKISYKTKEEIEEEKQNNPDSDNYKLKKFEGIFLPDNILDLEINNIKNKIFYIKKANEKNKDIKIVGIVAEKNAEKKKQIFTSELKEWNFNFNSPNFILATTKASGKTNSYSMSVNVKNASKTGQIQVQKGLTGIPNYNFTKILYTYKKNKKYITLIKDIKTKKETEIPNINTLAEKCVWSKNNIDIYCATSKTITGENLENWYKGKIYIDGNGIYKINTKTNQISYLFESTAYDKNFDIVNLHLDKIEKYLYFKDKKTDFYWMLKIR